MNISFLLLSKAPGSFRCYTSSSLIVPVKIYANADIEKDQIIKDNKDKSGIYKWRCLVNDKMYIGSSVSLGKRFYRYYNLKILQANKMIISKALLKYGYNSFSLEILEYCEPSFVISREQYYIDLLKPEYNILQKAGSLLGFKHSQDTKANLSALGKGRKLSEEHKAILSALAKGKKHSEEQKQKMSVAWTPERLAELLERLKSLEHQEHLKRLNLSQKGRARPKGAGSLSVPIEVLDTDNNETTVYPSISEAARAIGVTNASIFMAFKRQGESIIWVKKRRYKITKLSNYQLKGC